MGTETTLMGTSQFVATAKDSLILELPKEATVLGIKPGDIVSVIVNRGPGDAASAEASEASSRSVPRREAHKLTAISKPGRTGNAATYGQFHGVVDGTDPNHFYFTATDEEFDAALDEIAEMNRDLPVLPPDAFSRESIYEGY
jgi:hypothetical protein